MVVVGYKPWLARCIGIALVTLMLIVVAELGVRKHSIAENVPRISLPSADLQFSPFGLIDARIPRPTRAPTAPASIHTMQIAAASAAVLPEVGDEGERWSALLRPPGSDDS